MKIKKLDLKGYQKEFLKLVNTYEFKGSYDGKLSDLVVTVVKVYESSVGGFYARPDVGVRNFNGHPEYADRYGETEQEAIENSLNEIYSLVTEYYPNAVPIGAFMYRTFEDMEDEKYINSLLPKRKFDDNWRMDKVSRNIKGGVYIEFQLEENGQYSHWKDTSIFIGIAIFDPLYNTFCREPNDFNTYGKNLFSASELVLLKQNVIKKITLLESIKNLSDYLDKISPIYEWVQESNQVIWRELRDSMIEFLDEILKMIDEGIKNKKALFALGI